MTHGWGSCQGEGRTGHRRTVKGKSGRQKERASGREEGNRVSDRMGKKGARGKQGGRKYGE